MQLFSQAFQELVPATAGLPNFVFFHEIHGFIDDELIHEYLPNLGQRVLRVLGGAGVLVLTLWIMVQGVRIVTGQSRESMMTLVVNALLFLLTGWVADQLSLPFEVDGFWPAFWGAIVVALVSWAITLALPDRERT